MKIRHRIRVSGILRRGDAMLLVEQRNPDTGQSRWVVPGGGLEVSDADIFAAVVREVFEETGLTVRAGTVRCLSEYLSVQKDILMLDVGIECFPVAADFGEPTLIHTRQDDYLVDVRWWTRAELATAGVRFNPKLGIDAFWDACNEPLGVVTPLGRWAE